MSKVNTSKVLIASGTTVTWPNPSGKASLGSVLVESTGGAVDATVTIELNDGTNDMILAVATDAALTSVGFYPENDVQVTEGDSIKVTSTVSGNYTVRITTVVKEGRG